MSFNFKRCIMGFVLAVVLLALPTVASAETIRIEGNKRVEEATVRSYLDFSADKAPTPDEIGTSIKKLFATGLFSDVDINTQGDDVVVNVKENPIINEVSFEGNKRIEDDDIKKEVRLQSREVYTKGRVKADVKRIQDLYRKSGRFSVKITPKAIQLDQNRINLVYEIDEGQKATIEQIKFIGNERYDDNKLRKTINTQESRWYRFFSSTDIYDPDRIEYDKELLRRFYVSHGYADFRVTTSIAEITEDKQSFLLTFFIDEGQVYKFGEIKVDNKLADLKSADIRKSIKTIPDELFNANLVDKSVDAITQKLNDLGYAFVDVKPVYHPHKEQQLMDVTYDIQEGPKVYVNKININGNVRTLDKVVRREFRLAEGDPYNAAKIRRSEQRIKNLGFFKNVEVKNEKVDGEPDRVNLNVKVQEQSTGELNFGAGFSSSEGALANVSVRERNLLGKGQDLSASVQRASKGTQLNLGFTEPYFMGYELATGFNIFRNTQNLASESSYDSDTKGVVLHASYPLTEHLKHTLRYTVRNDDITNVQDDASIYIRQQAGTNMTSMIGQVFMWDYRDSRFEPTTGFFVRGSQDFAGFGGDSKFMRNEMKAGYYHPLFTDDIIFSAIARAGDIFAWSGGKVRINERFFVGSTQIRGFKVAGIGPRDSVTTDALGGNTYYTGSLQTTFPLGLPEELGIKGDVFADAGSLLNSNEEGANVLDNSNIRASVGAGVSWKSPLGPISIDVAVPVKKESFDKTQLVRFNFGTQF